MTDKSKIQSIEIGAERRSFLRIGLMSTAAICSVPFLAKGKDNSLAAGNVHRNENAIRIEGANTLDKAMQICADTYSKNRTRDVLSFTNESGYRMTVSPKGADVAGYPVAICMCPDLTFGMLGSRFMENRDYLDTFRGHLNHLPRNMRLNGKFFVNEDSLSGADRVLTQVMYPIWIWEIYLATGDTELLKFHHEPLQRCLTYIESRTSPEGIVNQVDADDWQYSEGADWVDWCPERMEGSTCVYHTWYIRALECCMNIFRTLGDKESEAMCAERRKRQYDALNKFFWNGKAYWDNLNFQGGKVGRFWCDSQIWPIAFGYASEEQASTIFQRIDGSPAVFEGVPLRWCAPIAPGDEDPRYGADGKYGANMCPDLRPYSWFGRLGSGDILARYRLGQQDHALKLILRFGEIVVKFGKVPECLDMEGNPQHGTAGGGNYLEHAGAYLWCVGKGMIGVDDTADGSLMWAPQIPRAIKKVSVPYWHKGVCWTFGCDQNTYWIDPKGSQEKLLMILAGKEEQINLKGKRISIPRNS